MAGFETVVRPVVFPVIRPQPARSLPPQDDPEKGFAVIKGAGGQHIDLTYSMNASVQISRPVETKRQVDGMRVYQPENGGRNEQNYVDVEVATKIWYRSGQEQSTTWYQKPTASDNVDVMYQNKIVRAP